MSDKNHYDYFQNIENRNNYFPQGYPRQDFLFNKIKNQFKSNAKGLEIGFGDGYLINKLSKSGFSMIGQDLSETNIETTKKILKDNSVKFLLGDASGKLLVEDASLDFFIASEVLEHMTDEELKICINEIKRVLKKGGMGYITIPANENLKLNECFCPQCSTIFHKVGHKQTFNEDYIQKLFNDFKILTIKKFFTRYIGDNIIENILGFTMFIIRTILIKFINIENATYFILIKK